MDLAWAGGDDSRAAIACSLNELGRPDQSARLEWWVLASVCVCKSVRESLTTGVDLTGGLFFRALEKAFTCVSRWDSIVVLCRIEKCVC